MSHHHHRHDHTKNHAPIRFGGPPKRKIVFTPHPEPWKLAIKVGIVFFLIFFFGRHVHPGGY